MRRRILIAFVLLVVPIASAQTYTITDLGSLSPTAINAWGQVVGNINGQAFIWTKFSGKKALGRLPGGTSSYAASINDFGSVAGTADGLGTVVSPDPAQFPNQQCSDLTQPFIWTPRRGMQGLGGTQNPVAYGLGSAWCSFPAYGTSINDLAHVVGYDSGPDLYMWGSVWTRAQGTTIFGASGYPPTMATGVSNTNQIVGQYSSVISQGIGHATSWKNGGATDLGTLGGGADVTDFGSSANGVNDQGQVVGWSTTNSLFAPDYSCLPLDECPIHAVLWTKSGGIVDLGTLPGDSLSSATSINYFGQVVGTSGNTTAPFVLYESDLASPLTVIGRPFLWTSSSGMRDLDSLIPANSGWILNSATGVNIWGQIVGSGTLNGQPHGFLLTPANPCHLP